MKTLQLKALLNISLKWRIFLFYIVFGFIPLLIISYFSIAAYTKSIGYITEKQVTQLVQRIADQTETLCINIYQDLDLLSNYPYVQLSFVQFLNFQRLNTLREKLEFFRANAGTYDRITLYSNEGDLVVSTPFMQQSNPAVFSGWNEISKPDNTLFFHKEIVTGPSKRIIIFKRVFDFQGYHHTVGYVSVDIALEKFVTFLEKLDIGKGIEKKILKPGGNVIFVKKDEELEDKTLTVKTREYSSSVGLLDWEVLVRIPEDVLFKDVNRLILRNLIFTVFVALFAIGTSLVFIRKVTKPIRKIVDGAKEFAAGNLDYRIDLKYGNETKRLADEFNLMAKQLKERQAELIQANKLASLGLLSAGIAHEIKNPLAGIKTSAQVLNRLLPEEIVQETGTHVSDTLISSGVMIKKGDYIDIKKLSSGIAQEVDGLNKTVTDLLGFARPGPSKMTVCNLAEIVDRALNLIQTQINKKRVKAHNNIRGFDARVDPGQMTHVFINLILNSLSAVEPGSGIITLTSVKDQTKAFKIKITDNGHGIPEEMIARIFDPFFSLFKKGTGLGLSIVYTLLKQNNVNVDVSSCEGEGTTFNLTFKKA